MQGSVYMHIFSSSKKSLSYVVEFLQDSYWICYYQTRCCYSLFRNFHTRTCYTNSLSFKIQLNGRVRKGMQLHCVMTHYGCCCTVGRFGQWKTFVRITGLTKLYMSFTLTVRVGKPTIKLNIKCNMQ